MRWYWIMVTPNPMSGFCIEEGCLELRIAGKCHKLGKQCGTESSQYLQKKPIPPTSLFQTSSFQNYTISFCCFEATRSVILCDRRPRKQYTSYVRKSQSSTWRGCRFSNTAILSIHNDNRPNKVKQTFKHV